MNNQLSSPSSSSGESEGSVSSDTSTTISDLLVFVNQGSTCLPRKRKTGRKKFKETRHHIYHGVSNRDGGKWVCQVREPCKKTRIWLGTYPTAELAALAPRGDQATLNFPDSALVAPRAKSTSARDIRLPALEATRVDHCSSSKANGGCKSEDKVETCSTSNVFEKSNLLNHTRGMFLDEEEVFNMPVLINSMAEGMLLTPPALKKGVNWDEIDGNDCNSYMDLDLW